VFKAVEDIDMLCFVCQPNGGITTLENYLDWTVGSKKTAAVPTPIINALIRDVLPLPNYETLDAICRALLERRTIIADVLAVEPRPGEPRQSAMGPYVPGAGHWWTTIWCRINLASVICPASSPKLPLFLAAHAECIAYLKSLPDQGRSDANVDPLVLASLYRPCAISMFDEDRALIKMTREKLQTKATPLEIIRKSYPRHIWILEDMVRAMEKGTFQVPASILKIVAVPPQNYKLQIAALCIGQQCKDLSATEKDADTLDALYFYFLAFLDLFAQPKLDDVSLMTAGPNGISPLQTCYPFDTRAYTADDLPNLYHVLMAIPLYGQQMPPDFLIAKFFQKCQPYSGQRRSLLALVSDELQHNDDFRDLFGRVLWCALANVYPGQPVKDRSFDVPHLLRCRQIVTDKQLLCASFEPSGTDTSGSLIVLASFRLYMFHMLKDNEHYFKIARQCIADLDKVWQSAVDMAQTIRSSNLMPDDVFARARKLLSRSKKSTTARVNRYKKLSCTGTLLKYFNKQLEDEAFYVLKTLEQDTAALLECPLDQVVHRFGPTQKTHFRDFFASGDPATGAQVEAALAFAAKYKDAIAATETEMACKQNILNLLVKMPAMDRLSAKGLATLMLPEYGGISEGSVHIVCKMVAIYYRERPMPKEYETEMEKLDVQHLKLITWYLNVAALLEKIRLVPLDSATVRSIQAAMLNRRYAEATAIDKSVYDVFLSLCCKAVKTLTGSNNYGHKFIAYNMDAGGFVCSKNDRNSAPKKRKAAAKKAKPADSDSESADEEDAEDEKEEEDEVYDNIDHIIENVAATPTNNRFQRKDFHFIPCDKQPVICVNLLGFSLQYGMYCYSHCIECAGLFRQPVGQFNKRCPECAAPPTLVLTCAICSTPVSAAQSRDYMLNVNCAISDPQDPHFSPISRNDSTSQMLYFCKRHYMSAKRHVNSLDKSDLFALVRKTV
jgi:hypothetical protein